MTAKSVSRLLVATLSVVLGLASAPLMADEGSRRIAITFDDAPWPDGPFLSGEERAALLRTSLDKADIRGAMFFVTTRNLDMAGEEGDARLEAYAEAGHSIANHSHSHRSADRLPADEYLADVERARQKIADYPTYAPYFRFPFLDEGNNEAKRDEVRAGLKEMGLRQGYVTVDNYDWYLQVLFNEAVESGQPLNLDAWRRVYVDTLTAAVEHYDQIAVETLSRSPAHVLLLHENDLAALFVDDLAEALRADGWEIIPALEAYEDPIAGTAPNTMLLGQGRVAAIAAVAGRPGRALRHPLESESELRALLVSEGLVDLAEGAYLREIPPGIIPKKFAPGVISLDDRYEFGTGFSPDGREMFFGVAGATGGEIRTSRYVDGQWTAPETILSHAEYAFADPFLSRDETRLYFISKRPAEGSTPSPTHDLWYVRRTGGGWSEPVNLGAPVNTASDEFFVSFTNDGLLAFASNRHEPDGTNFDIYLSQMTDAGFEAPTVLPGSATTGAYEADPFIAPDGSYIVFSSTRRSGEGRRDLYVTFRLDDGTWSRAVSLGRRINTPGIEFCPFVSRDGRFLFYTSNEDIYWVDAAVIELARQSLR